MINGWINLYKPRGISSAKAVSLVKKIFKAKKVGHTGTLDLEAEGVLPIAIGEATKLVNILMDARKVYAFTVQFGAMTDTGDSAGKIIRRTARLPSKDECYEVCEKFIGKILQTPPAYSALKINGVRAYKRARNGEKVIILKREITIYKLICTAYDDKGTASYEVECSKGTYIRALAEDIGLALQSLGFVIELRRIKVGVFEEANSLDAKILIRSTTEEATRLLENKYLKTESVLDDIPALEASSAQAKNIVCGRECVFDDASDRDLVWVKAADRIIAIGSLRDKKFKSSRVFNYQNGE